MIFFDFVHAHWLVFRAVVAAVSGLGILRPLRSQCYILALASSELPPAAFRKGEPVRDLYVDVAATQRSHQQCRLILHLIQDLQAPQSLWVAMFMIELHFLQNPHRIFYYFGYRALLLKISIPPKNAGISHVSRIGPPSFGAIWASGENIYKFKELSGHKVRGHYIANPNNSQYSQKTEEIPQNCRHVYCLIPSKMGN